MTDAAGRIGDLFQKRYGAPPEATWVAPGRVNLIGEHTDYNDGYVLPFAIPKATAVAASRLDGPRWTVWSEQTDETVEITDPAPGSVEGWATYVAGVIWVLRQTGHDIPGAALAVASDVPFGSGLSSSAAIECAVFGALLELAGDDLPIQDWPRLAQRVENEYVGVPSGIMDQAASTLCREGHALFLDCRSLATEHIPFDLEPRGMSVLVINTNAPHRHADNEYAQRRETCERAAEELGVAALRDIDPADLDDVLAKLSDEESRKRVRHVVTEDQRVLETIAALRAGDLRGVGPLLTASHASLRDDYQVTVPELDVAVDCALEAGAYGARMTGGGFGGCVLALADVTVLDGIRAAVRAGYERAGFTAPDFFVATAAAGAHRTDT